MYFNKLGHMYKVLKDISETRIYAGVPSSNGFVNMIALVQERGAHITTKPSNKSGFLWIPTSNAKGRKPSQIPNLYVRRKKGADHAAAGVDDATQPYGFRVYYVLKTSVDIPKRPFLRNTVIRNRETWSKLITQKAAQAAEGVIALHGLNGFYEIIGQRIVNDIKEEMREYDAKPNAPLTEERKGSNDPLIDKLHPIYNNLTTWSLKVREI